MISYFPEPYPDELFYSVCARFYAHTYPSYNMAIKVLCNDKNDKIDIEFGLNSLNKDTRYFLENKFSLNYLIDSHTMYPQYSIFETKQRKNDAINCLVSGEGDIHSKLIFPTNKGRARFLRYCPCCVTNDRMANGETYWHRVHQLRGLSICPEHYCRLIETNISMAAKVSPRLWVAEDVIPENSIVQPAVDDLENRFSCYMAELFKAKINLVNIEIHQFLSSKLEGTEYLSSRGKAKNISKLFEDILCFYQSISFSVIQKKHQLEKIFTGYNKDFTAIAQVAFFLGVSIEEMLSPSLPEKSQTQIFNEKVKELDEQGFGCYRISKELGCSPSTALKANRVREEKTHDYSVRTGMHKTDWNALDQSCLSVVRSACEHIYEGENGKPGRVTEYAITQTLGWPDKRLQYLPRCLDLVKQYREDFEVFWARLCVWSYLMLKDDKSNQVIHWRDVRDVTNLRRKNFERCKQHLILFTDSDTADEIKALI